MVENNSQLPWVVFDLCGNVYAISCEHVISLNKIDKITPMPKAPEEILGMMNFRSNVLELIDIKKIFNLKTQKEDIAEFNKMLDERLQDHINWINTLMESVEKGITFNLTTNPHECAFGKWYDNYKLKHTNIMFRSAFTRFDKPHKAIHEIGKTAKELVDSGRVTEAKELIEKTKNKELKKLIQLFEELKFAYKECLRETIVVISKGTKAIGLAVDEVKSIEYLTEIDTEMLQNSMTNSALLLGIGKRKDNSTATLINDMYLLDKYITKDFASC